MSKLPIAAAITVLSATALVADTERYKFDDFTSVEVESGVAVIINEGNKFSVEAEARRGNLRRLIIEENRGTLEISRKQRKWPFGFWNNDEFTVYIDMPDLIDAHASSGSRMEIDGSGKGDLGLKASSGSSIEFEGMSGGSLDLEASSGSTIRGSDIDATQVSVTASSGSTLNLSGDCEEIAAEATSGSTVSAQNLECRSGELSSLGGSSLSAHTSTAVGAKASGGASINIYGNPPAAATAASGGATLKLR